jgi:hypothetical protein
MRRRSRTPQEIRNMCGRKLAIRLRHRGFAFARCAAQRPNRAAAMERGGLEHRDRHGELSVMIAQLRPASCARLLRRTSVASCPPLRQSPRDGDDEWTLHFCRTKPPAILYKLLIERSLQSIFGYFPARSGFRLAIPNLAPPTRFYGRPTGAVIAVLTGAAGADTLLCAWRRRALRVREGCDHPLDRYSFRSTKSEV